MNTTIKFPVLILITAIFGVNDLAAQSFTDYIPAGYHTPFLKRGEFILSGEMFHYNNKSTLVGKTEDFNNESYKDIETNIHLNGFLAVSDKFTIGYSLFIFPKQTIFSGNREIDANFHVSPDFTVAYRLSNNFELFGIGRYDLRKDIIGDMNSTQAVPVGTNPTTGELIYEQKIITTPSAYDMEFRDFSVKAGFVWRGRF